MRQRGLQHVLTPLAMVPVACLVTQQASAQVTDEQIVKAIERGVQHLLDTQTDQGWWTPGPF